MIRVIEVMLIFIIFIQPIIILLCVVSIHELRKRMCYIETDHENTIKSLEHKLNTNQREES